MTLAAELEAPAPGTVRTVAAEPAFHLRRLTLPLPEAPLQVSDWRIGRGDKVALIGANGVGKTSLTEAVLGLRGGAQVEGRMLGAELSQWQRQPRLRRQLGVQLQRVFFPGRPRISELVALHRTLYERTSNAVLEALGIPALSQRLYEFLSRGETQRVDLFLALAHEPKMLFLDEPFTGLDPQFARRLAELLRGLRDTTLVMCCHTTEELELSTHTAWLSRRGIVRHAATPALLHELVGDYRLAAQCRDAAGARQLAQALQQTARFERPPVVAGDRFELASSRPLADLAHELARHPAVLGVDAGHSRLADLLRHCAKVN